MRALVRCLMLSACLIGCTPSSFPDPPPTRDMATANQDQSIADQAIGPQPQLISVVPSAWTIGMETTAVITGNIEAKLDQQQSSIWLFGACGSISSYTYEPVDSQHCKLRPSVPATATPMTCDLTLVMHDGRQVKLANAFSLVR